MRRFIPVILLCLAVAAATGTTQIQDGNLVLTVTDIATFGQGIALVMNPQTGRWTTLVGPFTNRYLGAARMAPNNTDLAIPASFYRPSVWWPCDLWHVSPGGATVTAASISDGCIEGFALDHDDNWVAIGQNYTTTPVTDLCWTLGDTSAVVTTLFQSPTFTFNDVAINRDPGASVYALGLWQNSTTQSTPKLVAMTRQGIVRTLVQGVGNPLRGVTFVELDPTTGDYVVAVNRGPTYLYRVTDAGRVTSLQTINVSTNGIRVNPDRTLWVVGIPTGLSNSVYKLGPNGSVITMIPITAYPSSTHALTGIEVYGIRALVCRQVPATSRSVMVGVQSRSPLASGASYILAASPARRPGIRFANGAWLNLDVTQPLFFLSALGLVPGIFQNFQGTLDPFGNATARVSIPRGLPSGLSIFVAGVIYRGANVIQVTNTHWFVL